MSYKCEILADSISNLGHRLTTFKVTYPRIIHAEMCRHRILSRNTASSRAIPFEKMVKDVQENPFVPLAWQKNHRGMQGSEYLQVEDGIYGVREHWLEARNRAVELATSLHNSNVTKQLVNRLLEPFVWTTELVSGTEWDGFFELRCPKYYAEGTNKHYKSWKDLVTDFPECENYSELDKLKVNESQAEIHIQKIAEMMWDTMNESTPEPLSDGMWHIPFMNRMDSSQFISKTGKDVTEEMLKISTARCARISYKTLGDNPKIDYEADIKLHDRLLESKHLSCFEHCSRAMSEEEYESFYKGEGANKGHTGLDKNKGWCNNYRSFIQYRYLIENQ